MATTKINLNGTSELDFTNGIASVSNVADITTITLAALGVTSVALTAPTEITVTGSPITSSGTIALSWKNETANQVFAGPTTGTPGTPGFRALVAADIPALAYVTGTSLTNGQLIVGAGSSAIQTGNLSGDVTTAGSAAATVVKLRGATLDATIGTAGAGQDGFVIYWDNASSSYKLKTSFSGTLPALGTPTVGGGTVFSNAASSATATASLTINIGDYVFVVTGNPSGGSTFTVSDNSTPLVLTQVQPDVNGTAIYTGTITGGGSNAHAGKIVTIAGFTNSPGQGRQGTNNGQFLCVASTTTTLTLLNPFAITEVHAATAANTYVKLSAIDPTANFTNSDCAVVCTGALCAATTISTSGITNASIAAATFTGIGGIGSFTAQSVTTTPGTSTITTTKANSMVVSGFLFVSTAGTITASSSSGTLQTNSVSVTNSTFGTAIVTTQATTVGSYTNAVALNRTATTGLVWTVELLPVGSQFNSTALTLQSAYWDGGAAVTDSWTIQASLLPTNAWWDNLWVAGTTQPAEGVGVTGGALAPAINQLQLSFSGEGGPRVSSPSMLVSGSIQLQKLAQTPTPTVTPTGGSATTWNYVVRAFDSNNFTSSSSLAGTTAAGAAALTSSAFNTVTWNAVKGAAYYILLRQGPGAAGAFEPIATLNATTAATITYVDAGGSFPGGVTINSPINWTGGIGFDTTWVTSVPSSQAVGGGLAILTGSSALVRSVSGWLPNTLLVEPNANWTEIWQIGFGATSDANDRISFNAVTANYSMSIASSRTTQTGNPGVGIGGGQWTITSGTATEVAIGVLGSEQTALARFVPTNGSGTYVALRIAPTINQPLIGPFNITNCNITSATSVTLTVSSGTGLVNGNQIIIAGCTGTNNAQLNGTWTLTAGGGTTTLTVTGSGWTTGNHAEATGTIKMQATGAWTMLLANPQITAEGSLDTANRLMDLQNNNTSKFAIDGTGKVIVPSTNTTTSATAGANGAVPAQVVGYLTVNINGTDQKIPYFNT